jgi:signal transduction histidine kinase
VFSAVLVLAPAVLVGWIAERNARETLETVIGAQLGREADHTARRLSAALERERETLRSFARQDLMRDLRVADIDKRVARALAILRDGGPARRDYVVVSQSGELVASSRPAWLADAPDWLQPRAGRSDGESTWGPVVGADGRAALLMATPVPDPDAPDRLLGRLVGVFDWPALVGATARVGRELEARGIGAAVLVVDRDGSVLSATGADADLEDRLPLAGGLLAEPQGGADHPDHPDYRADVAAGLLVGRAALAGGLPGWRLLVVETLANALAPARRLRNRIAVATALALTLALVLAHGIARRVVRPLGELTSAIQGLSRGDASIVRVPVRTRDEVGSLSEAFNHLASELDRVQRDLVDAEKFAFVGELASGVAHEVRTSLAVLRSSAQLLDRKLPEGVDEQARELAHMIRDEVDRLGRVVDDLLDLGRNRRFHPEPTPIAQPVGRAVELVEPRAAEKGIAIRGPTSGPGPTVQCDSEMIQEVCVNLLVNAVEALPKGGTIDVELLPVRDGYAGFTVRDDGAGVPEALRDRIFHPFVTAREGGVGLGLTFVKRVVHEHQGRIRLEPESGRGACFRVELPAIVSPA